MMSLSQEKAALPASRYSADMSKRAFLGTDSSLKKEYQEYAPRL